jgi:response regulator of citrate/malate metabolism
MKPFSYDDLRVRLEHYQQAYAPITGEHADQADVDRVFNTAPVERRLPKGFGPETLKLVEELLRRRSPADRDVSAAEAASLLGISRVSARRYLEHLSDEGRVDVSLRYGEVGRPERRYCWR